MNKILLIEDSLEIRENVSEILSLANYHVFSASNGSKGVKIAEKETPDLILCDIMMPGINGYEVFSIIKTHASTDTIPFIFMTAQTSKNEKCKGLDLGAEDYIMKPFDELELLAVVRSRIEKSLQLKEKIEQERLTYIKELENILHIISHRVRNPLSSNLGLVELLNLSNNVCIESDDLRRIIEGIKMNTLKLEDFTVELTNCMYQSLLNYKGKIEKKQN